MEKCKFCQADLEEGVTLCPACGKDNAEIAEEVTEETVAAEVATEEVPAEETAAAEEAPAEEAKKATPGKIAMAVAAIVVLVALLVALLVSGTKKETAVVPESTGESVAAQVEETVPATVPADGEKGTITEKGTYTVSDEDVKANAATVVATMEGRELTNAQLQAYYWMEVQGFLTQYASYASYFGLDYTKPLDTQVSLESEDMTWQHYFLQSALFNWQQIQAMGLEAEKAGLAISAEDQEYLDSIPAIMEENAANYSMELDEFMRKNIGAGAGIQEFVDYQTDYRSGIPYYDAQVASFVPTEEDLEAHFAENEEVYAQNGLTKESVLVDVRHILLQPESAAGDGTFTDDEWAACEKAAQEVLDTWTAGEKTEDSFAALANEKSTDPGSNQNGGLYEDVYVGQMVEPFNDWCFDAARQYGDTGLVKTDYGYHVMFFVGSEFQWRQVTESDWVNTQINNMFDDLAEKYPMEISYDKITLGHVDMG